MNEITKILAGLLDNQEFLTFCGVGARQPELFVPGLLTRFDLIAGFCDKVSAYVKACIPEVIICNSPGHFFLLYQGLYYDGWNTDGVTEVWMLEHFAGLNPMMDKEIVMAGYKEMPVNYIVCK